MGTKSNIQWCSDTWNPWHGCIKVSPGCKNCYMYTDKKRYGQDATIVTRSKTTFNAPYKLEGPLVFTCSWSDFFIEQADQWRDEAWEIIKNTPHLTYQILTKRPENILSRLPIDWGNGYENVWLGVSTENQETADERIPLLLQTPAAVRFISAEPLLGPIDLSCMPYPKGWRDKDNIVPDGIDPLRYQSGARSIISQCKDADVTVFMKQLGAKVIGKEIDQFQSMIDTDIGWSAVLEDKKGGDWSEWPSDLKIREFPA